MYINKLIRLSMFTTIYWITGFFIAFNAFPNITGELIGFGDRQFYLEWWNCKSLAEYWRTWNLPVHNFFKRHVVYPMQNKVF